MADVAHAGGALLAVDNCFCSPALQRPATMGADLVIHSGTKYLDGQGRVIAGAVCGPAALIDAKLLPVMRSAGMSLSPFNAWVVLKGLETLAVRMQAQSERALRIAQWLEAQPAVERVYYPGLPSHPQHALAMAQQGGRGGAVVSFVVQGRARGRVRGHRRDAHLLDHRQPGRHQDDDHPPGEHLARPADRAAAPGRRHHAGDDPRRGGAGRCRRHRRPTSLAAWPPWPADRTMSKVRTRIAPSPTGYLHLGTARTALYSWAYARHYGGEFVLRIEDTDVARSTQDAVDQILASMRWLGLDYDEGPFYQMQRLARYHEVVEQMIAAGTAYRCYCTPGRARRDARGAARARRKDALRRPLAARRRARCCRRRPPACSRWCASPTRATAT